MIACSNRTVDLLRAILLNLNTGKNEGGPLRGILGTGVKVLNLVCEEGDESWDDKPRRM